MKADSVRESFDYDATTGLIERKDKSLKRRAHTGTTNKRKDTSYAVLCLNGKRLYGHRAAWMHANGDIPEGMVIDHIDGDGLNNRLANLRLVSKQINQRNRRPKTSQSLSGVYAHRGGFVVSFASAYAGWKKDFFEACCVRKSLEAKNGYLINGEKS